MNQVKKVPMRQCMGCNEHKPKGELIRVVRSPEGEISLDFTGRKNGRGAYLCRSAACLRKAAKSHRIDRVLEYHPGNGLRGDGKGDRRQWQLTGHWEHLVSAPKRGG